MQDAYGLNAEQMTKIIRATEDALGKMRQLNNNVTTQGAALASANQSDSGRIFQDKFNIWAQDFSQISGNLQNLNEKAKALLNIQLASTGDAMGIASKVD
ncbi:hypothetical protein [Saccharopolyspora phatthalungensis]|uniref:Uncharacterized protein YukE n=1 Tax=Saccharopolyspora phatthalungensis TaxID=664693 RepID=A0A840Q6M0_9PSEU|nr:hypothetical protein [Saccharopolyspora phatthalungensis]MBB5152473.1 uncharacterized protein YukE [Saccharopolyspora phatthalungensis]